LALARTSGYPRVTADIMSNLALACLEGGELVEAHRFAEQAVEVAASSGIPAFEVSALVALGRSETALDDHEGALEHLTARAGARADRCRRLGSGSRVGRDPDDHGARPVANQVGHDVGGEEEARHTSTGSRRGSAIGGRHSSMGSSADSTIRRNRGGEGSMMFRSASLRMMASSPGSSSSRGTRTA
jgi:hypothetical protein